MPSPLSAPLTLPCGATLPNRLAKGAMSEVLADRATGEPTDRLVRLYERWSRSGAGLLITGNVMVDRRGMGELGNVLVEDESHLPGLRRWAEAAQSNGARLWMQINHAGRQAPRIVTREPLAPSPVGVRGLARMFARPVELSSPQILSLIERFVGVAKLAQEAGFSGVQLHGAHGYLISQFLSPLTNRRTDEWGGDLHGRQRFLMELVRRTRAAVGPQFPIGVKLNSADFQRGGFSIEESERVVQALEGEGVDLLEVSGGNYESPVMAGRGELPLGQRASSVEREAYFLDYARRIRARVRRMPLMLTGGMRSRAAMEEALSSGAVEVVGVARPMTYQPDLPRQLLDGTVAVAAAPPSLDSRARSLADALQILWFQKQIHNLADRGEADPKLGKWGAVWHGVVNNFLGGSKPARSATGTPCHAEAAA